MGSNSQVRKSWQSYYKYHFDMDVDFSDVVIPAKPEKGNWRLLFIARGLTLDQTYWRCNKLFSTWKQWIDKSLDEVVVKNIRIADKNYAIWVLNSAEPDSKTLGLSVEDADPLGDKGITLLERNVLEIKYYSSNGKNLDFEGATYCSGSYDGEGNVIVVNCSLETYEITSRPIVHSTVASGIRRAIAA